MVREACALGRSAKRALPATFSGLSFLCGNAHQRRIVVTSHEPNVIAFQPAAIPLDWLVRATRAVSDMVESPSQFEARWSRASTLWRPISKAWMADTSPAMTPAGILNTSQNARAHSWHNDANIKD
jgi:hypothetical protein